MGFERRKTYKLTWSEGEELEGLEVQIGSTNLRKYLVIDAVSNGNPPDSYEDEDGVVYDFAKNPDAAFEFLVTELSKCLLGWNLTDNGEPVPTTKEALWEQDWEFFLLLTRAWVQQLRGVSAPLPNASDGGSSLAEASIPMETL